jgi:DNA invertase Pin-like site-specific DNA recombinase
MKIGYARVSTNAQDTSMQMDALRKHGCERIFEDQESGAVDSRNGLAQAIASLRPEDHFVVWRLDRASRSIRKLIELAEDLAKRGVHFVSLSESIDTSTPGGKLTFHLFAALAEFERNLIRERTKAGLDAARARGRLGGRPEKLTCEDAHTLVCMYRDKKHSLEQLARLFGISKQTIYAYVTKFGRNLE